MAERWQLFKDGVPVMAATRLKKQKRNIASMTVMRCAESKSQKPVAKTLSL